MKLVLIGTPSPTEYLLLKQTVTVGSAPEADISLDDPDMFPLHAVIWQNRGMFAISDWNNQGGVRVNDQPPIAGQPLWAGDKILLGNTTLVFLKDHTPIEQFIVAAPAEAVDEFSFPRPSTAVSALDRLNTLDNATLEKLRRQRPTVQSAMGLKSFLKQGFVQAYSRRGKGIFGLTLVLPATALTAYHTIRAKLSGKAVQEPFPEGVWQFYSQFCLREDTARHANETDGFHRAIPSAASAVDQASAWVFQCLTTLFEYESLLENEWVERIMIYLVDEAVADSVVDDLVKAELGPSAGPGSPEYQAAKARIRQTQIERIELESERIKEQKGLSNLSWTWVKKRPYGKPEGHPHETYPQYRRRVFLDFLVSVAERLPPQMGALIWERYYELSATALPAYQAQMSVLYSLKPERHCEQKEPIPLWAAKLAFIAGGRYYLINVAHRDARGRLLAFKPGKPDDPGEPLTLMKTETGLLVDQQGRQVEIDRKGNVTLTEADGKSQIKVLHRTPASRIKAQIAAILHEAQVLSPVTLSPDLELASAPRAAHPTLIKTLPKMTQAELSSFADVPIIINWDLRDRAGALHKIRSAQRGIGSHALTIFRTKDSFVFDQSHIFFDAIWGMVISQIITDGAIETCRLMMALPKYVTQMRPPSPLRLQDSLGYRATVGTYHVRAEVTAEAEVPDLRAVNALRRQLARLNIPATVNDLLIIYRCVHDWQYNPSLDLQRALANLRVDGHGSVANQIEGLWSKRRKEPVSLFLPMDASFVNPKLRLFPATFKNFLPGFAPLFDQTLTLLNDQSFNPSPEGAGQFQEKRADLLANLLVLTEYFKMLKRITRQGESISTAAIQYLAHLPPGMQNTLDLIPEHIGALNEILKGEEVFSNVGRVAPASSLVRFTSAKDAGVSKMMVWGIMSDSQGRLRLSLRDFRPHVTSLLKLGYESLAELIVGDDLQAYAAGLNDFAEDLTRILRARIKSSIEV